jgi:DNA-binding Lrp family transcriptional regulator
MVKTSYVLVRLADTTKLLNAISVIQGCDSVRQWSAVDGNVHLVMKISSPVSDIPSSIREIESLEDLSSLDISQDCGEKEIKSDKAYTYLFIETEPAKKNQIKEQLEKLQEIFSVDVVSGGCDLVAVIEADNFQNIDTVIREKIPVLDGILRMKTYRVINLKNI